MTKASIHIRGMVAELMENKGKLKATVVCDSEKLLITLNDVKQLELGSEVIIEGEIKVNSIQFEPLERKYDEYRE